MPDGIAVLAGGADTPEENVCMIDEDKQFPSIEKVTDWLSIRYHGDASDLAPLSGGFWSSAFEYRVGAEKLVLRWSDMSEGFSIDAAAMRFAAPTLPVPVVVETGEAIGFHYAVSRYHSGRFIEDISAEEAVTAGRALGVLLSSLRGVEATPYGAVLWYDPESSDGLTWRTWLQAGLVDNPKVRVSGWRIKIASNHKIETVFKACESRIDKLLPACPERRDLVHGDLLHQNVLVDKNAEHVTAIFSWKCSVRGDFLFDVAWCTFWGPWHPGIAATDMWRRTEAADDLSHADLVDAPSRHHCYELQIAATHLAWNAWLGDDAGLKDVADAADKILERGPLS